MVWINVLLTVGMLALLSFPRGCDLIQPVPPIPSPSDRIYFSSFESPADTIGWKGWIDFRRDAPPRRGKQSAFIAGGCIHPHAYYELPSSPENRYLMIRCWGKNLAIGGGVELTVEDGTNKYIYITITDPVWKFYELDQKLFSPVNCKLQLSMSAGGIAPSSMFIDLFEMIA